MYRLLHIEADPTAQRAMVQALAQSPLPFALDQVADPAALAPPFDGTGIDALLLGTRDRASSLAKLARCRQWFSSQPIILLADTADLAFAREALRAGAQDVVQPSERALAVLPRILLYAIERAGAEARGKLLQAEAAGLRALLDTLLGMPWTRSCRPMRPARSGVPPRRPRPWSASTCRSPPARIWPSGSRPPTAAGCRRS
jgi:DNA-binding NtrC family response regulator